MPYEFRKERIIQFGETDMAGIVHFANFFRYMEETEHAFLRSLGLSVHLVENGRTIGFPRVRVECSYSQPLRFEDVVEIHLRVREKKSKSLTYEFIFYKAGAEAGQEVARGSVTVVSVSMDPGTGAMKAVALPESLADQLEAAPAGA